MSNNLLVEDDAAPDSKKHFDERMKQKIGISVKEFLEKGESINDDYSAGYRYKGYELIVYADAPYWHLLKIDKAQAR